MIKKLFDPNQERRDGIARIVEYLKTMPDGSRISWLEIERATGVDTTRGDRWTGRAWTREALKKVARPYKPLGEGSGIELSAPSNATDIAALRARHIVGKARSAHRSASDTLERHAEELSTGDRELLRMHRSLTGAMVNTSRGAARAALPAKEEFPTLPRRGGAAGE